MSLLSLRLYTLEKMGWGMWANRDLKQRKEVLGDCTANEQQEVVQRPSFWQSLGSPQPLLTAVCSCLNILWKLGEMQQLRPQPRTYWIFFVTRSSSDLYALSSFGSTTLEQQRMFESKGLQRFFYKEPKSKYFRPLWTIWSLLQLLRFAIVTQKQPKMVHMKDMAFIRNKALFIKGGSAPDFACGL